MKAIKFLTFIILSAGLILLVFAPYSEGTSNAKKAQTSSHKEKVLIAVSQSYGPNADDIDLPFEEMAVKMLTYSGLKVVEEASGDPDYVLKIEVEGKALGQSYSVMGFGKGNYYWTGASLNGKLLLEISDIPYYEASFSGHKSPPSSIPILSSITHPSNAPFKEVMESSTFLLELTRMVAELRGAYPLVAALKDDNTDVRTQALQVLKEMRQTATPALIAGLKDPEIDVQVEAANILSAIGEPAVDQLIAALADERAYVRLNVVRILSDIGDPRAVEPLIIALKDADSNVQKSAVQALGKIGDPRALTPLIALLNISDSQLLNCVRETLKKFVHSAVDQLIVTLTDQSPNVRREAANILGDIGNPQAVEMLIMALKDPDSDVQKIAAQALGKMRDPRAIDPLIISLRDGNAEVRMNSAEILGLIGNARSTEPLVGSLKDTNAKVRNRATRALVKIGNPSVDPLIAAMHDADFKVRLLSAWALGEIGDPRAVAPLIDALQDRKIPVQKIASEALGKITGQSFGKDHDAWQQWLKEKKAIK